MCVEKLVAYVAAPYRDSRGFWFVERNIRRAEAFSLWLWGMGYVVYCPHKNTARFDGVLPDDFGWRLG